MSVRRVPPIGGGSMVGVLPPAQTVAVSVLRTSTGLVLHDDFNRADGAPGANYTPNGPLAISGAKMVFSYTSGVTCNLQLNQTLFPDAISRHSQMVLSRADLNAYVGWKLRRIDATHYFFADTGASSDTNANRPRFDRGLAGDTIIGLGVVGTAAVLGSKFRLTCSTLASEMKLWIDDNLQVGVTDTNNNSAGSCLATGTPFGGVVRGASTIYLISVCSARVITINGLPTGWMARLAGINSAAAAGGGAVTIDPLGALLPIEHMDVIDATGTVQFSARVDAYGGDVFAVSVS